MKGNNKDKKNFNVSKTKIIEEAAIYGEVKLILSFKINWVKRKRRKNNQESVLEE